MNRMTELKMREIPPDLLLCPELRDIKILDFRNARELVAQGYEYAMLQRNEIKRIAFDDKR
jgi:predicted acylesterase/phospholipase RssA